MNTRADDNHEKRSAVALQRVLVPALQAVTLAVMAWQLSTLIELKIAMATTQSTVQRIEPVIAQVKAEQDRRGPILIEHSRFMDNYLRYHYRGEAPVGASK